MKKLGILIFLILSSEFLYAQGMIDAMGALLRSDSTEKQIFLCFTGHDQDQGFGYVLDVLEKRKIHASFFLTGDFVRGHRELVVNMAKRGHYVGAHSDRHLLYCDWQERGKLLVKPDDIQNDIANNLAELQTLGIESHFFMPPYEWYNEKVVLLAQELGQITVNFTPGTGSNADYTTPEMPNYKSSDWIMTSILQREEKSGLAGYHILIHPGIDPRRTDKFYLRLDELIEELSRRGYGFKRF
ncbi:polysaccharide deacetylase family protein [Dyadobacter tibetensis]|uniref:polysaccharide deacetylase family protein n=1 Tax=Dyadobacter tibetensis TaxID=1211851 RepID=UPI00046F3AA7|nr:polysaccharide deacetylase family protein [Dyadobacter tibetensis]